MLSDFRSLPIEHIETDICIVGAGPAGISLAREFIGHSLEVALLESGGIDADPDIQMLADGKNVGHAMPPMEVCKRQLGGNSNVWSIKIRPEQNQIGVRYVPYDEVDFEKRDWIPNSGWPFERSHLLPYYERAQQVCQLGDFAYTPDVWEGNDAPRLSVDASTVETGMFQFGPAKTFYADYRAELESARNVNIYTYATVVDIRVNDAGKAATAVKIAAPGGKEAWVTAKVFVLAGGGFQNARLLLAANQQHPAGLGNQYDVVGRYYHDHPQAVGGYFVPRNPQLLNRTALYDLRQVNGVPVMGFLRLSRAVQEREQLLNNNAILFPRPSQREADAVSSFKYLLQQMFGSNNWVMDPRAKTGFSSLLRRFPEKPLTHLTNVAWGFDYVLKAAYLAKTQKQSMLPNLGRGGWSEVPDNHRRFRQFEVMHLLEQSPDPDNRIVLSRDRDALGCQKLELHWSWSRDDAAQVIRAQRILAEELKRSGLGTFRVELDEAGLPKIGRPTGSAHLMGTTRMHDNPRYGVVDANCCVHGLHNLFVAGSSTFPTGGYANPTLTIVAMALRLGDFIKQDLERKSSPPVSTVVA
ncbi:GMC oxidoreductase [Leptolyngbya iicbica]|uniref:GMC family oxidoreductase n=2 Tax=Cyanophyceae TaxID=3028117 RepID=A0A4Q7EFW4_9CYAN|nr:GMC family oxidoreductase [Leptolyngbya sp. LK]RZM82185.1 GMC family oxidoreductase [Leptolyngbya sp. LK]